MRDPITRPAQPLLGTYLAKVVSVKDLSGLSQVQVRLLSCDGVEGQDGPIWARVAVPFAGSQRGAFLLPDVGDEVVVSFIGGDPRLPIVVGGLWNGAAKAPEQLGGDGKRVDRWTLTGKAGTRIAIIEERDGEATILLTVPGGVSAKLTQSAGGKIELSAAGATLTIDSAGVTISTSADVKVKATQAQVSAGMVQVNAGQSTFSGVVNCDTMQATTVIGATYTPGAGNVW